jgi:hypothetical protein
MPAEAGIQSKALWRWIPGLAEPVIGPVEHRTPWLAGNDSR